MHAGKRGLPLGYIFTRGIEIVLFTEAERNMITIL